MSDSTLDQLLDAALPHVPFDGWTQMTVTAAAADAGLSREDARATAPRGGVDLAVAYHKRGDALLRAELAGAELSAMRFRDRVAFGVRRRLEIAADREVMRRGVTLFALPIHAAEGARLIWGTADTIWTALGDTSTDYNWYSKRAILSGVYGSTTLFWLGDASAGSEATWAFLDRRIDDVMQFEKVKAKARENRLAQSLLWGPKQILSQIRAPGDMQSNAPTGLPGRRRN